MPASRPLRGPCRRRLAGDEARGHLSNLPGQLQSPLLPPQAQPLASIAGRSYLFLLLSGVATGLSWLCYYRALKLGPASLVAPVDKLSVVLVAIFGVALLGERLDLRQWCGIAAIGGGVLLLAWRP